MLLSSCEVDVIWFLVGFEWGCLTSGLACVRGVVLLVSVVCCVCGGLVGCFITGFVDLEHWVGFLGYLVPCGLVWYRFW